MSGLKGLNKEKVKIDFVNYLNQIKNLQLTDVPDILNRYVAVIDNELKNQIGGNLYYYKYNKYKHKYINLKNKFL